MLDPRIKIMWYHGNNRENNTLYFPHHIYLTVSRPVSLLPMALTSLGKDD
jgi:hypothetical protein